jgi:hypothetical protein
MTTEQVVRHLSALESWQSATEGPKKAFLRAAKKLDSTADCVMAWTWFYDGWCWAWPAAVDKGKK